MSASTESATVLTLPVVRDVPVPGLADLLAEVRAVSDDDLDGFVDELAGDLDAEEFAAQDLALAGESATLRARADRFVTAVEAGTPVDRGAVESVLAAFRSYEPLLAARDRRLNAAAYRRLAGASAPARRQVA